MKKTFMWFFMLNKRMFRKPGFIAILLAVPVLSFALRNVSANEKGILNIGYLAPDTPIAQNSVKTLTSSDSVMLFKEYDSEDELIRDAESGKVNAAWVFADDFDEQIEKNRIDILVTVYEEEEQPLLMLATLRLYMAIYPEMTYSAYIENLKGFDFAEDDAEQLRELYTSYIADESVFEMRYTETGEKIDGTDDYLTAPLVGILAVWMVVCAVAGSMYFVRDEENGLFGRIPWLRKEILSFPYILVPVLDTAVVVYLSRAAVGKLDDPLRELLLLPAYSLACTAFADLLWLILVTKEKIGGFLPVIVLVMLVCCPVFIEPQGIGAVRYLLPPYVYIVSGKHAVWHMLAYAGAVQCLAFLLALAGKKE